MTAKKKPSNKDFFVIAHNIRSIHNVGSIFRTADAFGVTKIFLTGYTGTPAHPLHGPKIAKTALGAEEYIPWEQNTSATRVLRKLRRDHPAITVIALENHVPVGPTYPKVISLRHLKPTFPLVLILGEEVEGIAKSLLKQCDIAVEIPMHGKKESLNVSVAFGVAAYGIVER